jgi:hypothetical protein
MLLEAVVALAILGVSGAATLSSMAAARETQAAAYARERRFLDAVHLMDAASLWSTAELDRRLGRHAQGEWALEIQRTDKSIYRLAVFDRSEAAPLLLTFVGR